MSREMVEFNEAMPDFVDFDGDDEWVVRDVEEGKVAVLSEKTSKVLKEKGKVSVYKRD